MGKQYLINYSFLPSLACLLIYKMENFSRLLILNYKCMSYVLLITLFPVPLQHHVWHVDFKAHFVSVLRGKYLEGYMPNC